MKPFKEQPVHQFFAAKQQQIAREIAALQHDYVLKASPSELDLYYTQSLDLSPLKILFDDLHIVDQRQTVVRRDSPWPGEYVNVSMTELNFEVPFEGDPILWKIQPSNLQYTMRGFPEIEVIRQVVRFKINVAEGYSNENDIKNEINNVIDYLRMNSHNLNQDIETYAPSAIDHIKMLLKQRRQQAEKSMGTIAALGIPMKQRDTPLTYVVPTERRPSPIQQPRVPVEAYAPEPELDIKEYDHILNVLRSMALVMERSPQSFTTLDEEALRTHFLIQLNGHYEGTATGETFNTSGKTDILIRKDQRNIFIAECKFWKGPKHFNDAIDQLLGYLSWRDVKCALIIFNKNRGSTDIRMKMHTAMTARSEYRKTLSHHPDGDSRYIFLKPSDPGREIIITTQIYDIPL